MNTKKEFKTNKNGYVILNQVKRKSNNKAYMLTALLLAIYIPLLLLLDLALFN